MQTLSVTIEKEVEKKFEKLLNDCGYEFSKHYACDTPEEDNEVDFVLTTEEEFDLVEIGILNECARQIKKLEDIEMENYKEITRDGKKHPVKDRSLLKRVTPKHQN